MASSEAILAGADVTEAPPAGPPAASRGDALRGGARPVHHQRLGVEVHVRVEGRHRLAGPLHALRM